MVPRWKKPKVRRTCPKCSYAWNTTSKLMKISCPSCGAKVDNPRQEIKVSQ